MAAGIGLNVVGWKVGAATPAILEERSLDAPIPGPLYATRVHRSPAQVPASVYGDTNLEAEFAFRVLETLSPRSDPYGLEELAGAVVAHAAFDLTQSRFRDAPDELLEIADSGNSGGAIIGEELPHWRGKDLTLASIELRIDGGRQVQVYFGHRRRDPLDVLAWLVNSLRCRRVGLQAGSYVLTGSITEPRRLAPGNRAVARFQGGGKVRLTIGAA